MKAKAVSKKKLIVCLAAIALIIAVTLALLFSCGNQGGGKKATLPSDSKSIMKVPPQNGETPDGYEGLDNIAFIIGRLAMRNMYHTETEGKVVAKVLMIEAGQTIYGSKDYKDGILLTSSVSISNNQFAPSKAIQRFYGDGKVVVREAATGKSEWKGSDVDWKEDAPLEILDEEQYEEKYGLWASEFSDYVINEETVLSVTPLEKTAEGLYCVTAELDPSTSVAYYVHQMKTMGGLDEYPRFSSVSLTFTFGEDWTIYSLGIEEVYSSKKGVDASCTGKSTITFSYDEASVDVSAYETYFKNYADAAAVEEAEKEYTAEDYLTYGFAAFLNDVAYLDADVNVCGQSIPAHIALDMRGLTLNSLKGCVGGLSFAYAGDRVYLNYKDFSGFVGTDKILSLIGGGTGISSLNVDALLQSVMDADIEKNGESVSMMCSLDLGGITVPVRFGFNEQSTDGGREVSLDYIAAELEIAGMDLSLRVSLSDDKTDIPVDENAVDVYPFIEKIGALVEGKAFALGISYADAETGLSVQGSVNADLAEGVTLGGNIQVKYGDLQVPVSFTYVGGTVYVSVYNVKVSAGEEELFEAIKAALSAAGVSLAELPDLSGMTGEGIASIVSAIVTLDYDKVIRNLTLTEEGFALEADLDELISSLTGKETSLGTLTAGYDLATEKFALNVLDAKITIGAGTGKIGEPADKDSYVSLTRLTQFIPAIAEIIESNGVAFELSFKTVIEDISMDAALAGEVRFGESGKLAELVLNIGLVLNKGKTQQICLYYAEGEFVLGFNGYKMVFAPEETERIKKEISALLGEGTADEGLKAAMLFMGEDGLDLNALLRTLKLVSKAENAVSVIGDFSDIIGEGNESVELTLSLLKDNKIGLSVPSLALFGMKVSGLNVFAAPVTQECSADTTFLTWAECDNLFEFILASYSALLDAEYLQADFVYESGELCVDAEGLAKLDAETNAEGGVTVTIGFDIKASIAQGGSTHYLAATLLDGDLWASYSTVGFGASGALRIKMSVADLFVTAGTIWPVIGSLAGVGETVYYYNFVASILNGYQEMSEYYQTINSDIFGLELYGEKSVFDAWMDIFLGIIGDVSEGGGTESESAGISVSFDFENKQLTLAGDGLQAALRPLANGAIAAPEGTYTDFSSLAKLAKAVMTSITVTEVTEAPDGTPVTTAKINGYYYLSGKVAVSLLGYDVDIGVAVSVTVKEDGGVKVNIHLDIPGKALFVVLINGDTSLDITIEDGMVYMVRTQTTKQGAISSETLSEPIVLYRVSTLDNFFGNILGHLSFMFNFGSAIADQIPAEPNPSEGGADIGEILTSYSYDEASGQAWTLGLNLSSLTDGALGASTLTLTAGANGVLQSFGFNSSVYEFISLSATINYLNPGESMESGHAQDITVDAGAAVRPLFGAALAGTDWSKVSFIEGAPATVTYMAEGDELGREEIAYDTSTGAVLTQLHLPDLSAYNGKEYTYVWGGIGAVSGDTQYVAQKTPNVYTVTLYSPYEIEGYTYAYEEGGMFVYKLAYTYGTTLALPVGAEWEKTYEIARITDKNGASITAVEGITEDISLEAEWEEIEYSVVYTVFGEKVAEQTYGYGEALLLPDEYLVNGYTFAGWNTDATEVESDMTVEGVYTVTVTLESDFAAEGFASGASGWYKTFSLSGTRAEDFALSYVLQVAAYRQFGWWYETAGGYGYATSLAGLDGKTLTALWVSELTAGVTSASKKDTGKLFAYKYDYAVSAWYAGGAVSGQASARVAQSIGFVSSVSAGGSVLYNSNSHSMTVTAANGNISATAYLTSNALYGNGYSYDFYYKDFNAYRITVGMTFACNVSGVTFESFSASLEGNF